MTLKVKVIYYAIQDLSMMHLMPEFGEPNLNPSKVIARKSPFFADFDLYDPQMTLKVKVKFHHIKSDPRSTHDVPNSKIWWP